MNCFTFSQSAVYYFSLFEGDLGMPKKLYLYISFVLVLCLALPTSAEETVLASYEKSEADACDLIAKVNDEANNSSMVVAWPMLQGTDANSYNPSFGLGLTVPAATDGECVLGFSWTKESDGRVDIHHKWSKSTFDLVKNEKILIDVYIVGPNGVPDSIDLWDEDLAWFHGQCTVVTGKWFTVTFDLSELQDSGTRKKDHSQITTIYFNGVQTSDGIVFFDNLRLWRPSEVPEQEDDNSNNKPADKP
jgi:hypothetical protein